jgi:predicted ATPase/anti-anti-sigma regulatory factor
MTLLAKRPEDRYQSDAGLRADLLECARQWEQTGRIEPFPLKRHDRVTGLRTALQLYGRETEIEALLQAFERARARGPELVLVSGYSGVGKSALVSEIHKPVARHGGSFVAGKFDPSATDVPLAPIAQALRELTRQILTEPADALAAWKLTLLGALKNNARVVTDLVPELELVIGPAPELPALGPVEAKNRLHFALQSFLGAFTGPDHPVVLFLDDLQWIDVASLKLLETLLWDAQTRHLLVVGAYRENEVQPGHPLATTLADLKKNGLQSSEIRLAPLDEGTVTRLVADRLATPAEDVRELASVIYQKTQGNPFFVQQLLETLYRDGLLRVDPAEGTWTWDLDQIRSGRVTDNVAELMVERLGKLAPATRRALVLASCIGFQFSLRALAAVAEVSIEEAARDLWPALEEGFVVPMSGDYRLLEPSGEQGGQLDADFDVHYRFLHDRVQKAAYDLAEAEKKRDVHLAIGRLLRRLRGASPREDDLIDIVHHLNRGAAGITDAAERVDLARLNLAVCRRAKASGAYGAAVSYGRAGIALLALPADEGWQVHYDLAFALHLELAECKYLNGQIDRAEATYGALLPRAKSDLDRARVYCQRLKMFVGVARYADAIKDCEAGLAALGQPLSLLEGDVTAALMDLMPAVAGALARRSIHELLAAPVAFDPTQELAEEIFASAFEPVYLGAPSGFPVFVLTHMRLLARGHTRYSASAYIGYAAMLFMGMGRHAEAFAYNQLALALTERIPNLPLFAYANLSIAMQIPYHKPAREAVPYLQMALEASMEAGDFSKLATTAGLIPLVLFTLGDPLEEVLEKVEQNLVIARRTRQPNVITLLTVLRQVVLNLMDRTRDPLSLIDENFKEEDWEAAQREEAGYTRFHIQNLLLRMRYFQGDYSGAMEAAAGAEATLVFVVGNSQEAELPFYRALTLLALPPPEAEEERKRRREILRESEQQIEQLARNSPRSFEHKRVLLEAEEARVSGDAKRAVGLYEEAIALAREDGSPHIEALATELAGNFYKALGGTRAAQSYLKRAYQAYLHWGAFAKAAAIEEANPRLLPAHTVDDRAATERTRSSTRTGGRSGTIFTSTSLGSIREAAVVVRAVQAVAGEMSLSKALARLATLVLENSGAERGALVLAREGRLVVEATFRTDPDEVTIDKNAPLDESGDIARTVVVYVARTMESIVLHDATEAGRFSEDPYIREESPQSILCLPLLHQGRLSGVLYLENRQAVGVFNAARVELLALLSSQAAISIENARLFEGVGRAKEELERELEERKQIERERAALQEQMIEAQRARLSELSTPLIPITDGVVVMPLIGTLDCERASQMMAVALEGAQRHRAAIVILDVTGIKGIDADVAGTLVGVAGALRLLGTEMVLTGIGPRVAHSLVEIGIDLGSFVTMGTLQCGMRYALGRVREGRRGDWRDARRGGRGAR